MKAKLTKKNVLNFLTLVAGNFFLALAVSFCFINYHGYRYDGASGQFTEINGILSGGTAGFSLIVRNIFHVPSENIETIITILTWFLFFIGLIFLGKKFALQTLVSTILYPVFLYLFKLIPLFDLLRVGINQLDPILCALIGGLLMGCGCGIVYRLGGSTGGFDIPGLIINKYTRIKLSRIFLVMDGLFVVLALIAQFSLYEVVIGLVSVLAYSYTVEQTQLKGTKSYICEIISDQWVSINEEILKLDRGTTLMDVTGGYTNKPRKLIKTMVAKNQYLQILDIVNKYDEKAFISMQPSTDIFGEGFRDKNNFSNK